MAGELTPKQEEFCLKYMETGSATDAYRHAYDAENMKPATIHRTAFELLENHKITARLKELKELRLKRHNVTVDRITSEYAKLAFLDIRKAFDEDGNLKPIHEMDDDTAAAIAGLEVETRNVLGDTDGVSTRTHKIKLSDKKGALDSLARHLGMFVERSEVRIRKPITEMTDDELNDELAEYERNAGAVSPDPAG